MILIDSVYQKVLALANKEQRGYITPQDFNLFADQAQMEIFEQYFYDINLARKSQGNDTVYADIDDMLEQKLQVFEASWNSNLPPLSMQDVYRIYDIYVGDPSVGTVACEIVNTKDFNAAYNKSRILAPTPSRPIAVIRNDSVIVADGFNSLTTPSTIVYIRVPKKPNWTYVVVNKKAMYNANNSTVNFELHKSEEVQLVNKILKLAGISNKQNDIATAGQNMEMTNMQLQPKI